MKGTLSMAVLGGMILLFSVSAPLWARVDTDEAQLETVRKDIDKDWSHAEQTDRIQSLAQQFNVAPQTVQDLRAKKQGWGETSIELAMAQHLTQTDATTYPTMTEALNKIEALRSQKMGWGKIANSLGFKLGPVVSAAQHVRNELRRESRPEKTVTQKSEKSGKSQSMTRTEKAGRPERVSRPERPARPERAARVH